MCCSSYKQKYQMITELIFVIVAAILTCILYYYCYDWQVVEARSQDIHYLSENLTRMAFDKVFGEYEVVFCEYNGKTFVFKANPKTHITKFTVFVIPDPDMPDYRPTEKCVWKLKDLPVESMNIATDRIYGHYHFNVKYCNVNSWGNPIKGPKLPRVALKDLKKGWKVRKEWLTKEEFNKFFGDLVFVYWGDSDGRPIAASSSREYRERNDCEYYAYVDKQFNAPHVGKELNISYIRFKSGEKHNIGVEPKYI